MVHQVVVMVFHCMGEVECHTFVPEHHTVLVADTASVVAELDKLASAAVLGIVHPVLGRTLNNTINIYLYLWEAWWPNG